LIGVGVDISRVFLDAARERARELEVAESITWVEGDAGAYPEAHHQFNIVSCLGATWIGGGLSGTLALMAQALHDSGGLLLVGEPFWKEPPPEAAYAALDVQPDEFTTLLGTLERIEATGFELVEMVGATPEGWDRYEAPQWLAVDDYLRTHPDDPEAAELRDWIIGNRWNYLAYGRRYFDWAVFVLRPR
jgi:SAM-dependent methyltransferase